MTYVVRSPLYPVNALVLRKKHTTEFGSCSMGMIIFAVGEASDDEAGIDHVVICMSWAALGQFEAAFRGAAQSPPESVWGLFNAVDVGISEIDPYFPDHIGTESDDGLTQIFGMPALLFFQWAEKEIAAIEDAAAAKQQADQAADGIGDEWVNDDFTPLLVSEDTAWFSPFASDDRGVKPLADESFDQIFLHAAARRA